jgi:hypothetical protein
MVSLVLTIIAFAGAMGVPALLTAIVESAFKIRPSSSRTKASRRMNWTDRCRPVAMLLPRNGTLRAWGTTRTPYGTRRKSGALLYAQKSNRPAGEMVDF